MGPAHQFEAHALGHEGAPPSCWSIAFCPPQPSAVAPGIRVATSSPARCQGAQAHRGAGRACCCSAATQNAAHSVSHAAEPRPQGLEAGGPRSGGRGLLSGGPLLGWQAAASLLCAHPACALGGHTLGVFLFL